MSKHLTCAVLAIIVFSLIPNTILADSGFIISYDEDRLLLEETLHKALDGEKPPAADCNRDPLHYNENNEIVHYRDKGAKIEYGCKPTPECRKQHGKTLDDNTIFVRDVEDLHKKEGFTCTICDNTARNVFDFPICKCLAKPEPTPTPTPTPEPEPRSQS